MWTNMSIKGKKSHVAWSYLYGPAQVDACFNGHVVGGLEEGPLQEQGKEEQHSQHIRILQKLFGGNEIDPQQSHLEAQTGRERGRWRYRPVYRCKSDRDLGKVDHTG